MPYFTLFFETPDREEAWRLAVENGAQEGDHVLLADARQYDAGAIAPYFRDFAESDINILVFYNIADMLNALALDMPAEFKTETVGDFKGELQDVISCFFGNMAPAELDMPALGDLQLSDEPAKNEDGEELY